MMVYECSMKSFGFMYPYENKRYISCLMLSEGLDSLHSLHRFSII